MKSFTLLLALTIPAFSGSIFFDISSQCNSTLNSVDSTFYDMPTGPMARGNLASLADLNNTDLSSICESVSNWTTVMDLAAQDVKNNCSAEIAGDPSGTPALTYKALKLYDPLTQIRKQAPVCNGIVHHHRIPLFIYYFICIVCSR